MKKYILKFYAISLISLLLFTSVIPAYAEDADIDYEQVAALLIKEKFYDRAIVTLNKIKKEDVEDKGKYNALYGLAYLRQRSFATALRYLEESILHKQENVSEIYLNLAETYNQLERPQDALKILQKVTPNEQQKPIYVLLKSSAYWLNKQPNEAFSLINSNLAALPPTTSKLKKVQWLIELNLVQAAQPYLDELLRKQIQPSQILALAGLLRKGNHLETAVALLEKARLIFEDNENIAMELADAYLRTNRKFAAISILENYARRHGKLYAELALLHAQVGNLYLASFYQVFIKDDKQRLEQKLAVLLEEENYLMITALNTQFDTNGLTDKEEVRYALAFSYFKTGQFERADFYLNQISKTDLFEKATEVKRRISSCRTSPEQCYETI